MGVFQKNSNVRVTAVCDVYEPNLAAARAAAQGVGGQAPRTLRACRKI